MREHTQTATAMYKNTPQTPQTHITHATSNANVRRTEKATMLAPNSAKGAKRRAPHVNVIHGCHAKLGPTIVFIVGTLWNLFVVTFLRRRALPLSTQRSLRPHRASSCACVVFDLSIFGKCCNLWASTLAPQRLCSIGSSCVVEVVKVEGAHGLARM